MFTHLYFLLSTSCNSHSKLNSAKINASIYLLSLPQCSHMRSLAAPFSPTISPRTQLIYIRFLSFYLKSFSLCITHLKLNANNVTPLILEYFYAQMQIKFSYTNTPFYKLFLLFFPYTRLFTILYCVTLLITLPCIYLLSLRCLYCLVASRLRRKIAFLHIFWGEIFSFSNSISRYKLLRLLFFLSYLCRIFV